MLYKKDWHEVKVIFEEWWGRELNRPLIQVTVPKYGEEVSIDSWAFLRYYPNVDEALYRVLDQMSRVDFLMEAYPNVWVNLGPGSLSAYLGAELKFDGKVNTAWFEGNFSLDEVLEVEFNPKNEWWIYTCLAYEAAREKCRDKAIVAFTDLLDPVTVVGQLRGQYPTRILRDMFFEKQKLKKALDKVQSLFFKYFEESCRLIKVSENGYSTWADIWSREKHFVLQCDTIVYLSPKIFRETVYPLIIEECDYFQRTIWHLDGPLELKHLDDLLNINSLNCIQWVPGEGNPDCGEDCWIPLYRKIQEKGKLIQIPFIPPEKIAHILSKISPKGVALKTSFRTKEEMRETANNLEKKFGLQIVY
ncbi:MAG: hypothetical protein QXU02_02025 [Candidatus Bathyarchaeia archaeon]